MNFRLFCWIASIFCGLPILSATVPTNEVLNTWNLISYTNDTQVVKFVQKRFLYPHTENEFVQWFDLILNLPLSDDISIRIRQILSRKKLFNLILTETSKVPSECVVEALTRYADKIQRESLSVNQIMDAETLAGMRYACRFARRDVLYRLSVFCAKWVRQSNQPKETLDSIRKTCARVKMSSLERKEFYTHLHSHAKECGFPYKVNSELAKHLTRYGLSAHSYDDGTTMLSYLYYGTFSRRGKVPLLVYLPGRGEIGSDLIRQFNCADLFRRVTSREFQRRWPCALLAISPTEEMTTLLGGSVENPTDRQHSLMELIRLVVGKASSPQIDTNRIYITGFSYGGNGVYALATRYPGYFAAAVPISAMPPVEADVKRKKQTNWYWFFNGQDYAHCGFSKDDLKGFADAIRADGGDFRIGTYPDAGHNAWTKAWQEDAVWDWMFSKSLTGSIDDGKQNLFSTSEFLTSEDMVVSATIDGEEGCIPECAVDGLTGTSYRSLRPFGKDDWWMAQLKFEVNGSIYVKLGECEKNLGYPKGVLELSLDGKTWIRSVVLNRKTGLTHIFAPMRIKYVRIRLTDKKPQRLILKSVMIEDAQIKRGVR